MEDGLFAEIVLNHLRHEVVDGLVVGRAVTGSIDDGHIAGTVGGQEPGHTNHGVGVEGERIEELVGETAVDHAHTVTLAGVIQEIDLVVHHFKVFREGKCGTGFLSQVGMFEERGIVSAWREDHDDTFSRDEIHGFAQ